jgi:hypothetical protein
MTTPVKLVASTIGAIGTSVLLLFAGSQSASAVTLSATESEFCSTQPQVCSSAGSFNLSVATPTSALSDATFDVSLFGDFDSSIEFFTISVEGFDLGSFLNNTPGDDLFDNASFNDTGNQYSSTSTATAIIPQATLNSIIADGFFTATFTTNNTYINNLSAGEFAAYDVTFTEGAAAVPEPLTILGSATALGFGALFKRQRSKSKKG